MAAAAFRATLVWACGSPSSADRFTHTCTVSDVAGAYYIFPDGNNFTVLPSNKGNLYLVDVLISPAAGTDTTQATVYVGGRATPYTIQNTANLYSVIGRQYQQSPLGFAAGSQVRFTQAA